MEGCVIRFNVGYVKKSDEISEIGEGRYRLKNSGEPWNNFQFQVSDPSTPAISEHGNYELEVNVKDVNGLVSNTLTSEFKIPCANPRIDPNQNLSFIVYRDQNPPYANSKTLKFLDMDGLSVTNGQILALEQVGTNAVTLRLKSLETKVLTGDSTLEVELLPSTQSDPGPGFYIFPVTLENGVGFDLEVRYQQS